MVETAIATANAPTILLVDDDTDVRSAVRAVLENETSYRVDEAADGLIAWEYLRAATHPTVVISDHQMPRLDGPGLLSLIAEASDIASRVASIYLTAGSRIISPALQRLLDDLAAPALRKPFDIEALLAAVAAAAGRLAQRTSQSAPDAQETSAGRSGAEGREDGEEADSRNERPGTPREPSGESDGVPDRKPE